MIQPTFKIESIKERYDDDIATFTKNNKIILNNIGFTKNNINISESDVELKTSFTSVNSNTSVSNMKLTIKKIIDKMNTILHLKNYVDKISHLHDPEQKHMWILRTVLFYQLLIILVHTLTNKEFYDEMYLDKDKYPYRADVSEHLTDFKMGIFGSMNPTSDIDLGVEYTGNYSNCQPSLAYIVSRIENLFIILTGSKSLDFDIETYADMATIPNNDKDCHDNIFYLSTYTFDVTNDNNNFMKLVECATNSISRNYLLAHTDTKDITLDKMITDLKLKLDKNILNENIFNIKLKESLKTLTNFLKMDYNTQRYTYYEKVEYAEKQKKTLQIDEDIYNLSNDDTAELMYRIGIANTYRMESYCCIPTIIHVVRILQQQQQQQPQPQGSISDKYQTKFPKENIKNYCEDIKMKDDLHHIPVCTIGNVGYILSMLEQIGYMYRFNLTYCVEGEHKDQQKCDKKIKKYKERFDDALQKLSINVAGVSEAGLAAAAAGGNRRFRTRTRKVKHMKVKHMKVKHTKVKHMKVKHMKVKTKRVAKYSKNKTRRII